MKKILKNIILALTITSVLLGIFPKSIMASDMENKKNELYYDQFSVSTLLPENQANKNVSYFDLLVEPKKEQTLEVTVTNAGNKSMNLHTQIHRAQTATNGGTIYQNKNMKTQDETIPNDLNIENMISISKQDLSFAPKETKNVQFILKTPNKNFDGILLGGITFYATTPLKESSSNNESTNQNLQIKNRISYTVGIQLTDKQGQEKNQTLTPNLKKNNVKFGLYDLLPAFLVSLENTQPILMKDVTIEGTLKNSKQEVIATIANKNTKIAPNSTFDISFTQANKKFENGKYFYKIIIKYEEKTWVFEDSYEIKNSEKIDEQALTNKEKRSDYIYYILLVIISLLAIVIIILFIIIINRRKNEKMKGGV